MVYCFDGYKNIAMKKILTILAKIKAPMQAWFSMSAIIIFIGCIGVTVFVGNQLDILEKESSKSDFERESQQIVNAIERRMNEYTATLLGGKALFNASNEVSRDEWQKYYETLELENNYPGIQAFAYSVALNSPLEVQEMITKIQNEGYNNFSIRPSPEGREDITAIIYIEPLDERNIEAFGYDMNSEDVRHASMEKAIATGEPQLSGKVTLVQEIDEDIQAGTLLYVPVYKNGAPVSTEEEREKAHIGFVYAAFRMGDLLTAITKDEIQHYPIHFAVYDGTIEPENLLFKSPEYADNHIEKALITEEGLINIIGRNWAFAMHTNNTFLSSSDIFGSQIARVTGGIISVLIYIMLLITINTKDRVQKKAKDLTKEIEESQKKLKKQNTELLQANTATGEALLAAKKNASDLKKTNKMMVGRELKMIELKKENGKIKNNNYPGSA
jgi:CHASE1-domain containing sensor protein